MSDALTKEQLMARALGYIARRKRSKKELTVYLEKLMGEGSDEGLRDQVISRLEYLKYINDEEYARAYSADARRLKKWGALRIKIELQSRGISDEIIQKALGIVAVDSPELSESQLASDLVEKSMKFHSLTPEYRVKVVRRLVSRGIPYDIAITAIDAWVKKD